MKGLQFGIKEQNIALKVSQKHDPDKNVGDLAGECPKDEIRFMGLSNIRLISII